MPKKKPSPKKKISSKKKSTELYYKGKRLNNFFKDAVKETARIKKQNVSTPARLKKFYEANKDKFGVLFEIGIETTLKNSTTVFNQFDTSAAHNHEFFVERNDKLKPITELNAKFQIAKFEQLLNVTFGSTGVEFSYRKKLDGSTIITLPDEKELEEIQDEPVELISDYLASFGIKIYVSDETKKKKFATNEQRRKTYSARVTDRFKQFRKEYNAEKRKAAAAKKRKASKSKAKRKKR